MIAKLTDRKRNAERCAAGLPAGGHASARAQRQRGMTLAELLVALTVLSVLFGLLFMPLMKSFGYIHTGNVRIGVQDTARTTFEAMVREISDAWDIYDNGDDPTLSSFIMVMPQGAGANANLNPATGSANTPPLLITPGPGPDYNISTPLHVEYLMALTRKDDPYYNENEYDIRGVTKPFSGPQMEDNLWRVIRLEYYPFNNTATPDPAASASLLSTILGGFYPAAGQEGFFREPGAFEDSPFPRMQSPTQTAFQNSQTARERRGQLQKYGMWAPLTPADMDAAWCNYMPDASGSGVWSMKPGIRFESEGVRNEVLSPVLTGSVPYPTAYQAAHGHWQIVRRKAWSHPAYNTGSALPACAMYFQLWKTDVTVQGSRGYYVAARPGTSSSNVETDPNNAQIVYYYVFRKQSPTQADPGDGAWPSANLPVFNMTRYQANISLFRRGPADPNDLAAAQLLWNTSNPYHDPNFPTLFPQTPDATKPYWPEMAFLQDPRRGVLEFRVDPPVRVPQTDLAGDFQQPAGPMAPFQAPYGTSATDAEYVPPPVDPSNPTAEPRTDWILPDMRRAQALAATGDTTYDAVLIPADTMRVMVYEPLAGGGYAWQSYTRVSREPGRREFTYDERTGHLALGDENRQYWAGVNGQPDPHVKVRAWYQIQTNATANRGDVTVTASYLTKEIWHVTLALRGYDTGTGRSQPFQLTATVRPRNLH